MKIIAINRTFLGGTEFYKGHTIQSNPSWSRNVPDTTVCHSCKQPYKRGSRFCTNCGAKQISRPKASEQGKGERRALITKDASTLRSISLFNFYTFWQRRIV